MWSGLHRNMSEEASLNLGAGGGGYFGSENLILVTAEIHQFDSFTIKCDFKCVWMFQSADLLDGVGPQLRPDLIFSVDREVVMNQHASACSQRQTLNMIALGQIHSRRKRFRRCRNLCIAQSHAGYLPRDGKITFH